MIFFLLVMGMLLLFIAVVISQTEPKGFHLMASLSQATLDLINKAEGDLEVAKAADGQVSNAQDGLNAAEDHLMIVQADAANDHTIANASALAAIAALKAELGITTPV